MSFIEQFESLHREHQPAPFWFLNDRLSPQEMRRQVRAMAAQEFGGFFLHARMGRETPYLGDEWFEAVGAAIDEAARHGMHAWIYDEDNWPSGYAGGAVLALGSWVRQRYLRFTEYPADVDVATIEPHEGLVALFELGEVDRSGDEPALPGGVLAVHRIEAPAVPATFAPTSRECVTLLVVTVEVHNGRREFCPEEIVHGYVDVFNPAVTDRFIESTYEEYYRRFAPAFGSTVRGFFFDEPQFHELGLWGDDVVRFPYSAGFHDRFRAAAGRDFVESLPWLFYSGERSASVRYDYYRMLAEEFRTNFTKRLATWCDEHGVELTGHVILEEHPRMATRAIGDPMLHYRDPHVPGIDHLGKDLDLAMFWSSSHVLCKQAQSAANQLGRNRVLCETFAGGTNDFGMTEQKWMGDWLHALGVNFLCYHAFHYSLRGYRKRDYPPTFNYQQPWFELSAGLCRHFGRLSWAIGQGERVADILLIHPMDSFFATQSDGAFTGDDELSRSLRSVSEALVHSGYDWDYGNEAYLAELARVSRHLLKVGRARYRVVVIPPLVRLRASTIDLLTEFAAAGGALITIEWSCDTPSPNRRLADAVPPRISRRSIGAWDAPELTTRIRAEVAGIARPTLQADVATLSRLVAQKRIVEGGEIVFIASGEHSPRAESLSIPTAARTAYRLDPANGGAEPLPRSTTRRNSDATIDLALTLGGSQSALLFFPDPTTPAISSRRTGSAARLTVPAPRPSVARTPLLGEDRSAEIVLTSPNALILDRCVARLGATGPEPRTTLELSSRINAMRDGGELDGVGFDVQYTFRTRTALPGGVTSILIERPDRYDAITIDGTALPTRNGSDTERRTWFVDRSLELLSVPADLAPGRHELRITGTLAADSEIESPYLVGDFGVAGDVRVASEPRAPQAHRGELEITAAPTCLVAGSWTAQGLPFYAGSVTYRLPVGLTKRPASAVLRFGSVCGTFHAASGAASSGRDPRRVRVNGALAGEYAYPPYDIEIADLLRSGSNLIEVEVMPHLRNFLGPHHVADEAGVDCFCPADHFAFSGFTESYLVKPAGILGAVWLETD